MMSRPGDLHVEHPHYPNEIEEPHREPRHASDPFGNARMNARSRPPLGRSASGNVGTVFG